MPTLPLGIYIPDILEAKVMGVQGQRYKVQIGNVTTTFPLDWARTQLKPGQAIIIVGSYNGIRMFDLGVRCDDDPYPVIGALLSGIRVPRDFAGLILFDPSHQSRDAIAISKTQAKFNDLELAMLDPNIDLEKITGHHQCTNGLGKSYLSRIPLSEFFKEPQLITHYRREAAVIPLQGLAEPIGNSPRLRPAMLEYCVERVHL